MTIFIRTTLLAICLSAGATGLASCADPPSKEVIEAGMRSATAEAIGMAIGADLIEVSSVERTPTRLSWMADTPDGRFRCSSDERGQLPECTPLGSST